MHLIGLVRVWGYPHICQTANFNGTEGRPAPIWTPYGSLEEGLCELVRICPSWISAGVVAACKWKLAEFYLKRMVIMGCMCVV